MELVYLLLGKLCRPARCWAGSIQPFPKHFPFEGA